MLNLTLHNLDETVRARLQRQAQENGRSLEEEAKEILRSVLIESPEPPLNLASKIRQRFTDFGELELPEMTRDALREPPTFEDLL